MYRQYGPGGRKARLDKIQRVEGPDDMERLVTFEKIFFSMDQERTGQISMEEIALFLSFVALDMDVEERSVAFDRANMIKDEHLTRSEFCELCRLELWDVPLSMINLAVDNMLIASGVIKERTSQKWKRVADMVDVRARTILPSGYIVTMIVLFNLDFRDDYATNPERAMSTHLPRTHRIATVVRTRHRRVVFAYGRSGRLLAGSSELSRDGLVHPHWGGWRPESGIVVVDAQDGRPCYEQGSKGGTRGSDEALAQSREHDDRIEDEAAGYSKQFQQGHCHCLSPASRQRRFRRRRGALVGQGAERGVELEVTCGGEGEARWEAERERVWCDD